MAASVEWSTKKCGKVAEACCVLVPLINIARRVTAYIDKDGKVLKVDGEIHPATSTEDIARTLDELGVPKKG